MIPRYNGIEAPSVCLSGTSRNEAPVGASQMEVGGDSSSDLEMFGSSEDCFDVSDTR